jgi:hypothetical protein
VTPKQALALVEAHGVVLESARGPVPSLAEAIAGEPIRGSWWSHPKAHNIFLCSRAIRESDDVLVCRLIEGKITYVHRRVWSALARLAKRFGPDRLAAVEEMHTRRGKHEVRLTPFADWLPKDVLRAAELLTEEQALSQLAYLVHASHF